MTKSMADKMKEQERKLADLAAERRKHNNADPNTRHAYPIEGSDKEQTTEPVKPLGLKDDGYGQPGKVPKDGWHLVPWDAVAEMVKVLDFGARKYGPGNWQHVEGWRWRYFRAAVGHLMAWWRGETKDHESGLHPLAHALCCVCFLLSKELADKKKP